MAPSKLRQVVGAVKDQTSIGLAKVGASGGGSVASELDVAIVKATRHGESFPAEERHVREVLALSRGGHAGAAACVSALSRRLGRTRSWAVALKTLAIVHRLLLLDADADADDDGAVERELLCATRRGTRMLNLADFCDRSRADAWDFSAFVRTYAAYLGDRLEYRVQARQGAAARGGGARPLREEMYTSPDRRSPYYDDDVADADGNYKAAVVPRDAPAVGEMTPEQLLDKAGQLQHLLGRFIACRPVGAAKSNRVVAVSLYPVVKESVQLYCDLTEVMAALIDQFPEMETADCERVHDLFVGLANDMDELQAFYAWCKDACVCRQSDVPDVEVVTHKKLQLMDEFIRDRRAAESQQPHHRLPPPSPEPAASPEPPPPIVEENVTKALPAPEEPASAVMQEPAASPEPEPLLLIAAEPADEEADFLNLKADAMSSEAHGHQMALALFNGNPAGTTTTAGDAFDPSSADWETALVQSASALATQRAELGGGFNTMVLDGMYGHATANATVASAQAFSGSASSVAMRPPGAPMLALPGASGVAIGADPFAASAVVPPPMYVQMSDLQTKQQLLREEQMVWQRYGKNGMQGPGALAMLQQRPHHHQQMPHGGHNYYAV